MIPFSLEQGERKIRVSQTSAYKITVRTDSADSNALLLLDGGELVAILIELADESHGDARGGWTIESTFGINATRSPQLFASARDAADWITRHISGKAFDLSDDIIALR